MGPFGEFPLLTVFVLLVIMMVVSDILFPKQRRLPRQWGGDPPDRSGPPVCRACGEPQTPHALYCRRCGNRLK
jgi:hypothetical protein